MLSWRNMPTAFFTSETETPCGVVTTTAPAIGTLWAIESATSPVPGRQVDHEVVELAPRHVAHELLHRAVQHGPAPDDRLVGRAPACPSR